MVEAIRPKTSLKWKRWIVPLILVCAWRFGIYVWTNLIVQPQAEWAVKVIELGERTNYLQRSIDAGNVIFDWNKAELETLRTMTNEMAAEISQLQSNYDFAEQKLSIYEASNATNRTALIAQLNPYNRARVEHSISKIKWEQQEEDRKDCTETVLNLTASMREDSAQRAQALERLRPKPEPEIDLATKWALQDIANELRDANFQQRMKDIKTPALDFNQFLQNQNLERIANELQNANLQRGLNTIK